MKLKLLLSFLLTGITFISFSQSLEGKVYQLERGKSKEPLPGANVHWAGTATGTSTDKDGKFYIQYLGEKDTILY